MGCRALRLDACYPSQRAVRFHSASRASVVDGHSPAQLVAPRAGLAHWIANARMLGVVAEIVGEAEQGLGIPREVTGFSLRQALALAHGTFLT